LGAPTESCPFPEPSFTSLEFPNRSPTNNKTSRFSQRPLERSAPCSPKWGPYGNRCPFPEPYLAYPSGSPIKESSLQVPIIELPQREMLFPETSFIHLSKSPVNEPPFQVPQWGPYGERCLSPEPFFTYPSGSPIKEPPIQVPLTELPQRETLHFQSPPYPPLKVPDI
jgi:hypothetical protein